MYNAILVRYGELTLKGKNRNKFIKQLKINTDLILNTKSQANYDSMILEYSDHNLKQLKYVFGISSYSPVAKVKSKTLNIERKVKDMLINFFGVKTFKLIVKRRWKEFEFSSQEMISKLAKIVYDNTDLTVDVIHPDLTIEVDLKKDATYIFSQRIKCLGGLPVGISGQSMHLISGGIDSPVAAFEMMKRGISISLLSFITPPQTDQKTKNKINKIADLLNNYQPNLPLYQIDYSELMNYISLVSNQSFKITLMRRSFYRIAQSLAQAKNILSISNGENLGQVASQTIESMHTIQNVLDLVVYRPLLTKDKNDIVDMAKKINTYEISIEKAVESCELFAPKKPVIKPTVVSAKFLESELDLMNDLEKKSIEKYLVITYFHKYKTAKKKANNSLFSF